MKKKKKTKKRKIPMVYIDVGSLAPKPDCCAIGTIDAILEGNVGCVTGRGIVASMMFDRRLLKQTNTQGSDLLMLTKR